MNPTDACYSWMFRSTTDESNLDVLLDVRRGVEGLKELSATFRMTEVTEYNSTVVPEEAMWTIGSWRLPEWYDSQKAKRYVNPNYVHRTAYADVSVECECGARMLKWTGGDHTEDCQTEWRVDARERLREKRHDWIKSALRYGIDSETIGARMGLERHVLGNFYRREGIEWMPHRKAAQRRFIYTIRELHDEYGHTYAEIAEAFGYSPSAVRSYAQGHGRNIKP